MGTQYQIWNKDKNEFIDANSLGWDSKKNINTTGRFSGLLYFLINDYWNGDRIHIIALEYQDYEVSEKFYKENKDITVEAYSELKESMPNEEW